MWTLATTFKKLPRVRFKKLWQNSKTIFLAFILFYFHNRLCHKLTGIHYSWSSCPNYKYLNYRQKYCLTNYTNFFKSRPLFSFLFIFSMQLTVDKLNKVCRWLDSNCGPMVLEPITLPTKPQPLTFLNCFQPCPHTLIIPIYLCLLNIRVVWHVFAPLAFSIFLLFISKFDLEVIPMTTMMTTLSKILWNLKLTNKRICCCYLKSNQIGGDRWTLLLSDQP